MPLHGPHSAAIPAAEYQASLEYYLTAKELDPTQKQVARSRIMGILHKLETQHESFKTPSKVNPSIKTDLR
jgi:hypothetical protein